MGIPLQFRDCRDIARWDVQCELAAALGVDISAIEKNIHDGTAFARDWLRQKLYGNVGFRIIETNIQELLQAPGGNQASWG